MESIVSAAADGSASPPDPAGARAERVAFATAFLISFGVYAWTLAPTVTLEDSGELAVAADYLGVPHPPGYPIWTLLAWLLKSVFSFVPFRGHPNPAWGIALLSALCGAGACGVLAALVCGAGRDMLRGLAGIHEGAPIKRSTTSAASHATIASVAGVAAALLFAFSPGTWSQAVIVEVYSLNALFLALILWAGYRWICKPSERLLCTAALLFGLGLTNYQVLLLLGLSLCTLIALRDLELFRDFLIALIMFLLLLGVLQLAGLPALQGFPKYEGANSPLTALRASAISACALLMCGAALSMAGKSQTSRLAAAMLVAGTLAQIVLLACLTTAPVNLSPQHQTVEAFHWRPYIAGAAGLLAALAALCLFRRRERALLTAFLAILAPLLTLAAKGILRGLVHPTSPWFWFYVVLNIALLSLVRLYLPRGRTVAKAILLAQLGVAFYALMPLVSDLGNPPMNWGYPLTWEGFLHAVTRGQYEPIEPAQVLSTTFLGQIGVYLTDLRRQYTLLVAPLALLPWTMWRLHVGRRAFRAFYGAAALFAVAALFILLQRGGAWPAAHAQFVLIQRLALLGMFLLVLPGLCAVICRALADFAQAARAAPHMSDRMPALAALLPLPVAYLAFATALLRRLMEPGPDSLAPYRWQVLALVLGPPLMLMAVALLMRAGGRLRSELPATTQRWMLSILAGFLAMSLLLIALANLKGDLQDTFVQRVKFISSHALYCLWIGYGLLLGLYHVVRLFPNRRWLQAAALLTVALLPLLPVHQNAVNDALIREMGGAEQRGHEFGWQFGYYALEGARGIREELSREEEPLPDPTYPPAMRRDAIFFGGTDPGRFVPTYMIYSAHVREDIYLITQNALADDTYMSVMRDLYGDDIWIPSRAYNGRAFSAYVMEEQRNSNSTALVYTGPLVQIRGAQEVMKINALLARRIFDENAARHAFYLEESFTIPWMVPYLTPHGLILQLNRSAPAEFTPGLAAQDLEFWDWMTRRLTADTRFLRDPVARKTFSKLRSAIASLYAERRQLDRSERAYREAIMLYPASPEATFLFLQKVLWPQARLAEVRLLLDRFRQWDPGNFRVATLYGEMEHAEQLIRERQAIMQRLNSGQMTIAELLKLCVILREGNQKPAFLVLANSILQRAADAPEVTFLVGKECFAGGEYALMRNAFELCLDHAGPDLPVERLNDMVQMAWKAKDMALSEKILKTHLARFPGDYRARINMAVAQVILQKYDDAHDSLARAIALGGAPARAEMLQDIRLRPVLAHEKYRDLLAP